MAKHPRLDNLALLNTTNALFALFVHDWVFYAYFCYWRVQQKLEKLCGLVKQSPSFWISM